eukprot:sb/3479517/
MRDRGRLFWDCKVKRHIVDFDCKFYGAEVGDDQEDGLEGSESDLPINPSRSWEQFMNKNNKDELEEAQPEIEKDYNHATKSTGSDPPWTGWTSIPGPQGPPGPPGLLVLGILSTPAYSGIEGEGGRVKKERENRKELKNGEILVIVCWLVGIEGRVDELIVYRWPGRGQGGFYGSPKSDIFVLRFPKVYIPPTAHPTSHQQLLKPKASPGSFTFNSGIEFNHRSGAITAVQTGAYLVSATINLQRIPGTEDEVPTFEDNITGRLCTDDDCILWALETRVPVLNTKFSHLKLDGIIRIEVGKQVYLYVENNSGLSFKVLRTSSFSAHMLGDDGVGNMSLVYLSKSIVQLSGAGKAH